MRGKRAKALRKEHARRKGQTIQLDNGQVINEKWAGYRRAKKNWVRAQ